MCMDFARSTNAIQAFTSNHAPFDLYIQMFSYLDTGKSVLDNCQINVDFNTKSLEVKADVRVRQLDWHTPFRHLGLK